MLKVSSWSLEAKINCSGPGQRLGPHGMGVWVRHRAQRAAAIPELNYYSTLRAHCEPLAFWEVFVTIVLWGLLVGYGVYTVMCNNSIVQKIIITNA